MKPRKRNGFLAPMFAVAAFSLFAYDWPQGTTTGTPVVFGSPDAPLASGSIAVPAEGASAASLTVMSARGASVSVDGGDVQFGSSAEIALSNATVDVNVNVSAPASLSLSLTAVPTFAFSGIVLPVPPDTTPIKVMSDVRIEDIEPVSATGFNNTIALAPFNVKRTSGTMDVQFQYTNYSTSMGKYVFRCVKVRFEQSGDDVAARVLYGLYAYLDDGNLGYDTDSSEFTPAGYYSENYGINRATFDYTGSALSSITFNREVSVGGDLQVGSLVDAVMSPGTLESSGVITNTLSASGGSLTVEIDNPAVEMSSLLKGDGGELTLQARHPEEDNSTVDCDYTEDGQGMPSSWTVVATNALLSSVTNVTDVMISGSAVSLTPLQSTACCFTNDGLRARFLIENFTQSDIGSGKTVKAVAVELIQQGGDIAMRSTTAYYRSGWTVVAEGYDFFNEPCTGSGTASASYYIGRRCRLLLDKARVAVKFTGKRASTAEFSNVAMNLKGTDDTCLFFTPTNRAFCPRGASGALHLYDGVLVVPVFGGWAIDTAGGSSIFIHPGSVMISAVQTIPPDTPVCVDDASIVIGAFLNGDTRYDIGTDGQCYLGSFVMKDGARLRGAAVRMGYSTTAARTLNTWRVEGSQPSFVENNIQLCSRAADSSMTNVTTNQFDVSDVTGDSSPDLFVSGGLVRWRDNWSAFVAMKTGEGTMHFTGTSTMPNDMLVQDGCLSYANNALSGSGSFVLCGGALSFDADATNSASSLSVAEDGGAIVLESGANFSVSSASIGGRLAVTLPRDATLRIGTSQCLSSSELRRISVNDLPRTVQDTSGYIHGMTPGMTLIIK